MHPPFSFLCLAREKRMRRARWKRKERRFWSLRKFSPLIGGLGGYCCVDARIYFSSRASRIPGHVREGAFVYRRGAGNVEWCVERKPQSLPLKGKAVRPKAVTDEAAAHPQRTPAPPGCDFSVLPFRISQARSAKSGRRWYSPIRDRVCAKRGKRRRGPCVDAVLTTALPMNGGNFRNCPKAFFFSFGPCTARFLNFFTEENEKMGGASPDTPERRVVRPRPVGGPPSRPRGRHLPSPPRGRKPLQLSGPEKMKRTGTARPLDFFEKVFVTHLV